MLELISEKLGFPEITVSQYPDVNVP
uniref:Uncharacterized protein n=1 Tax=Anguilla anguilla TaxID=7936 RepID=A0A0E9RD67_ANGAN